MLVWNIGPMIRAAPISHAAFAEACKKLVSHGFKTAKEHETERQATVGKLAILTNCAL